MEVCAGGTAEEPGGGFLLTLPPSAQVLISIYELPHVPTRPPPEGAKSVFAHNLHSLTRPSFTLTGTHGVYKARQKYYSPIFFPPPPKPLDNLYHLLLIYIFQV